MRTRTIKNIPMWKQNSVYYKQRKKKTGPSLKIGQYILGFVLLMVAGYFGGETALRHIMVHPIFNVREVYVDGVHYLNSEEIIKAAGIDLNTNIFHIDVEQVASKVKKVFTAENFTVYRCLPNRIKIEVHERKPVALLNTKELIGVDKDGVPLPHIGASFVEKLPIVTGIALVSDLSDSTVKARLVEGLKLLGRLENSAPSTYKRISEINVSNMSTLGISLIDNGLEVIIGNEDWGRKIPLLDKVINEVVSRSEAVKALDIRFGEVVVVKK